MGESVTFNCDCMEYMKTLPDGFFDLAVVDPPYGDGLHAEDGGGKGWFTKYNQKAEDSLYNTEHRNLRGRFDRYNDAEACSQSVQVERERELTAGQPEQAGRGLKSTAKKSSRGTLPRRKAILQSCSASHAIKSSGAATSSACLRRAVSLSGANCPSRKTFQWLWQNTHGRASTATRRCLNTSRKASRETVSIQRKSQ